MSNIDELIEWLRGCAGTPHAVQMCNDAADALEKLQAENKRLNKIVCSIPTTPDSGRTVSQYDKEMSMCAYLDDLEAENEKLRAELERMKKIMRDNGIMTIPPKYPGGPTEWNIPKPRGQKED